MKDSLKQFYNQFASNKEVNLPTESKQQIKANLMAQISSMGSKQGLSATEPQVKYAWRNFKPMLFKSYVVIPLVLLLLIGGSTIVSANALPGDNLYPLKRGVEAVSLLIAPTAEDKTELQVKFAKKRIAELESLKQRGAISNDQNTDNSIKIDGGQINPGEQVINNTDNTKPKPQSPRRRNQILSPQLQKNIEDEAKNAQIIIDQDQIRKSREQQQNRDNEDSGLRHGFKIEQQSVDSTINFKLHNK